MNGYDDHSIKLLEAQRTPALPGITLARRDNRCTRTYGWRGRPFRDTLPPSSQEAALTPRRRRELDDDDFALPDDRAYPIDTPDRARSALARAAQHASPSERRRIRKAVAKRYPSMEVGEAPRG